MASFIGVHECTIDGKGRIIIPAPLKRQLMPYADKEFILKRSVFSKCLELYVLEDWKKIQTKVNSLNPFVKKHNDFKRMFSAGIKEVNFDTTGRILVTKDLLTYSGITKDVIIASAGNIIEVWDKDTYESVITDPDVDFGTLAEEVMGDFTFPED